MPNILNDFFDLFFLNHASTAEKQLKLKVDFSAFLVCQRYPLQTLVKGEEMKSKSL